MLFLLASYKNNYLVFALFWWWTHFYFVILCKSLFGF